MAFLCFKMHRGEILEAYLRSQGVNLTKLAGKLPWTVKTMYRHFEQENLPWDKLADYAAALKYDFKLEFPELQTVVSSMREPESDYRRLSKVEDNDYYRRKYEDLLEKYTDMLERYNELLVQRQHA